MINDHESQRALTNSHVNSLTNVLDRYILFSHKSGPGSSLRGNYRKGVIIGGANHNGGSTSYGGRGMGRGEEGSNYNRGVSNHDGHEFLKTLA